MSDVLTIQQDERVRILTLNRPEKRNALNVALCRALVQALEEADPDEETGAILIRANGKSFCAGMDLSEIGRVDPAEVNQIQEALFTIGSRLTKPLVMAVHGAALAGGTGLVANAHIVIAAPDATFGLTEIRIGLWPFLVFRQVVLAVGERRAVEMSLSGRIVTAQDAQSCGLVHELAADPQARAREIAGQLSRLSASIMQQGLSYVNQARHLSSGAAGELARHMRDEVLLSAGFAEGLTAFRKRRDSRFNPTT